MSLLVAFGQISGSQIIEDVDEELEEDDEDEPYEKEEDDDENIKEEVKGIDII